MMDMGWEGIGCGLSRRLALLIMAKFVKGNLNRYVCSKRSLSIIFGHYFKTRTRVEDKDGGCEE